MDGGLMLATLKSDISPQPVRRVTVIRNRDKTGVESVKRMLKGNYYDSVTLHGRSKI